MTQMSKFLIILAVVIYVISPFDLIPDFLLPFFGWIDDTVLISMLIYFLRTGKFPGIFTRKRRPMYGSGTDRSQNNAKQGNAGYNSRQNSFSQSQKNTDSHRNNREEKTPQREKTPHEVLGLALDATQEEIRSAYVTLAKQYHPDKVAHLGKDLQILAEKRFKEIQQAYARISSGTPS